MSPDSKRPSGSVEGSRESGAFEGRTTETCLAVTPMSRERDRPTLTLISGVDAGQVFALQGAEIMIGRTRESGVRLDDAGISRQHARMLRGADGSFVIEDLGSTNGVYVNGEKTQRRELAPGDQVQVGPNVTLRYSLVDASEEALARQLFESSTRDALTKAFSRKYLMARLVEEVAYAARHKTRMGLILFDLDHFKQTNDTYGHSAGDAVLKAVSNLVARLIRTEDVFARYGGEEFVVLVRSIAHDNVVRLAERIRKGVEELEIYWENQTLSARVSMGVASLDDESAANSGADWPGPSGEALVALADARLYQAKDAGRNRIVGA